MYFGQNFDMLYVAAITQPFIMFLHWLIEIWNNYNYILSTAFHLPKHNTN